MYKKEKYLKYLFLFVIGFVLFSHFAYSQTYGLKFQNHDVPIEQRTGLDLTPNKLLNLENEFEISFDYKIIASQPKSIFGYVFRIINQDNINVDLISTPSPYPILNMVIGKSNSLIPVDYPENAIDNWIKLRIKFITKEDKLIFYTPDTFYVQNNIGFKDKDSYKIVFGLNNHPGFETTDVPSMCIRDVKIVEQGHVEREWRLDENVGNIAADRVKNKNAEVKNPEWLSTSHQEWQNTFNEEIDGNLIVAFDDKNSRIFMLGNNEYYIYSVNSNSTERIEYKNKPLFLSSSHRIIYNPTDNKIYCYQVDGGPCYILDIETQKWNNIGFIADYRTRYKQHNSFYNAMDNSIYAFGGYGRHAYNSEVRKIDLTNNTWNDLPTNDTIFYPRYMSGLGLLNDTVYILGGFGSVTGNQSINPHSYFDLLAYSIKDSLWIKKYDLPHVIDNMLVGNSFMIDQQNRDYYALVLDKTITNPDIQLIRGNLDSPVLEFVGNKIPITFHDIKSFISLFYSSEQEKLIAYTSYLNESGKTEVKILSLNYPPNELVRESVEVKNEKTSTYLYLLLTIIFLSGLVIWIFIRRRKKGVSVQTETTIVEDRTPIIDSDNSFDIDGQIDYQLTFFGGFQVFDKDSEDVTSKFSKLLKELLLLILLHTFKNNKGISIEKITEVLWHDKSVQSARNNRAVNIRKLRTLIEKIGSCELSNETGYWKIIFNDPKIKCDYIDFLKITASKTNLTKLKVNQLLNIAQKGAFLGNVHYDWLDEFKATVSDTIINTLVGFAWTCDIKKEADFIIHLADSIFNFDIINEDALILKCKAHHSMGKYSHAKVTYEKFFKEYQIMYDQEYETSFVDILEISR